MKPLELEELPAARRIQGGTLTDVAGVRCGVAAGGIKAGTVHADVALIVAPGVAAAVTTRSTAAAAPCVWTRGRVPGRVHAVVVNSGNANAATGARGERDTASMAARVAALLGCATDAVLVCSTGVIGVPMPMDRLLPAIQACSAALGEADGHAVAQAIMTTDTRAKSVACEAGGVRVAGVAKGSGMVHPNMGTMLGFLVTDADVEPSDLQALLETVVDRTFNAVSVDGDMSTNDTVIVQATGAGPAARPGTAEWDGLALALETCCRDLARSIASDGEGATTLMEVAVIGTEDDVSARAAARAVGRSPLVKSALHGRDPNWGRIVGALGAAGVRGLDALDLDLAGVPMMRAGVPLAFDEAAASAALTAPEVLVAIRVPGPGVGRAWGCDLSADYVRINADYRS